MIGRAVHPLMDGRFDNSSGNGAGQQRGVQDAVCVVLLLQQMCSNSARDICIFICHLMRGAARKNDWDPVVGLPNGAAGPDPPGSGPAPPPLKSKHMF